MRSSSIRVPFLFILAVMSSALPALTAPQEVKYRQEAPDQRGEAKPIITDQPRPPADVERIQHQLLALLYQEPAFQGVGTQLTSDPGVTTYRIYVNRRLLRNDELPERIKALLASPGKYLDLASSPAMAGTVNGETSCVGPWCFKPVRMEPLRTFAVPMGGSTSTRAGCFEGTIGLGVADNTSAATGWVTNNHVAAAEGPLLCPNARSAPQVSPGTKATMCHAGSTAGTLRRRPEIEFAPRDNLVDAAFVKGGGVQCDPCGIHPNGSSYTLAEAGSLAFPTSAPPQLQKCGAATGHTTNGTIVSNDAWVRLIFLPCGLTAQFSHQIEIAGSHFAMSGDSGAWVFDARGKAVGMIFAGDEGNTTFVNPADVVLSLLNVHIVPCP
jgi:hypothetical protein